MKEFPNKLFCIKRLTNRQEIEANILKIISSSYYHCLHDLTYEELIELECLIVKGWPEECRKW